jgi:hypothetical protein
MTSSWQQQASQRSQVTADVSEDGEFIGGIFPRLGIGRPQDCTSTVPGHRNETCACHIFQTISGKHARLRLAAMGM